MNFIIISIQIFLLILSFILSIGAVYALYSIYSAAPYVPSNKKRIADMLEIANLQKSDILLDLGSGDGRILLASADSVKQCIGIEINPLLYYWSKIKAKLRGKRNITIIRQNLWKTDLSGVDVLTIYFIWTKMDKLKKKIKREMKPGSRVISHAFTFSNWTPEKSLGKIYLYIV